tara:strand:- start:607 stop:1410 length:804 start_codon:yes stop_codon:yes gene_type:complete
MEIFKDKKKLQSEILGTKGVSFVPTMGGLHKGHISLIKNSKKTKLKTLVSIFVNPKQFNEKKDFKSYPRNQKKDLKILRSLKVDYLYLPSIRDIYDFKPTKKVFLDKFSNKLCGKYRKFHFPGVLNVVNRFLDIIKPKKLFLGKKDFQQLYLIKKHTIKRKINTKIVECETIREKNGIACSSRNFRLSSRDKKVASKIYFYLKKNKYKFNYFNPNLLKKEIIKLGADKIDYIEFYNIKNFKKSKKFNKNTRIFIAYYINKVRLIDNI